MQKQAHRGILQIYGDFVELCDEPSFPSVPVVGFERIALVKVTRALFVSSRWPRENFRVQKVDQLLLELVEAGGRDEVRTFPPPASFKIALFV